MYLCTIAYACCVRRFITNDSSIQAYKLQQQLREEQLNMKP